MPDRRRHRGPHPEDAEAFAPQAWPKLAEAVGDLSWLLSRGYAEKSALKLVGDRLGLTERQRLAVMRCACSDAALAGRRQREVPPAAVRGAGLLVDGYNVLTTIEAALAGGFIIKGRDGCYRDMASMHGTFRNVSETIPAIELLGEVLGELGVGPCTWYLDQPVSNSGRLRQAIYQVAQQQARQWQVEVVPSPDAVLSRSQAVVASADSVILDACRRWFNLARIVIEARLPDSRVVTLDPS